MRVERFMQRLQKRFESYAENEAKFAENTGIVQGALDIEDVFAVFFLPARAGRKCWQCGANGGALMLERVKPHNPLSDIDGIRLVCEKCGAKVLVTNTRLKFISKEGKIVKVLRYKWKTRLSEGRRNLLWELADTMGEIYTAEKRIEALKKRFPRLIYYDEVIHFYDNALSLLLSTVSKFYEFNYEDE